MENRYREEFARHLRENDLTNQEYTSQIDGAFVETYWTIPLKWYSVGRQSSERDIENLKAALKEALPWAERELDRDKGYHHERESIPVKQWINKIQQALGGE